MNGIIHPIWIRLIPLMLLVTLLTVVRLARAMPLYDAEPVPTMESDTSAPPSEGSGDTETPVLVENPDPGDSPPDTTVDPTDPPTEEPVCWDDGGYPTEDDPSCVDYVSDPGNEA